MLSPVGKYGMVLAGTEVKSFGGCKDVAVATRKYFTQEGMMVRTLTFDKLLRISHFFHDTSLQQEHFHHYIFIGLKQTKLFNFFNFEI